MALQAGPWCRKISYGQIGYELTWHSYFTSVFVSLGVFLFGYDQGVMSGIITYVLDS
jgi:hypothetical protein